MSRVIPTTIISHWYHPIEGLTLSSQAFYADVEHLLADQQIDHLKIERVNMSEGGMFSAKREYLQVRRGDHVFYVCGAPFGNRFFVSWWLGHAETGFAAGLAKWPLIGFFVRNALRRMTYYKLDTALMFQSVTHGAVTTCLDTMLNAKGLRTLSDTERTPVMRDFFAQIGGH